MRRSSVAVELFLSMFLLAEDFLEEEGSHRLLLCENLKKLSMCFAARS